MNKAKFFDAIRSKVNLTTANVSGINQVLDYIQNHKILLGDAAYSLGTGFWETAGTMQPVKEAYWKDENWRKRNLRYYPWYGRGLIQTTWKENYIKIARAMGLSENTFINNPDLLLTMEYALPAMFIGMSEGIYTGKDLDDYIDNIDESDAEDFREYKAARKIVNGTDKDDEIARLALVFEAGLKAAGYDPATGPVVKPTVPTVPVREQTWWEWFKGFFS